MSTQFPGSKTADYCQPHWTEQLESLHKLATRHGAHTVVLRDPLNLSWFTGARWHVPQTLNLSCFDVVVSGLDAPGKSDVRIVANTVEAPRLRDIEFPGQAVEFDAVDWTADRNKKLPTGPGVLSDAPGLAGVTEISGEIADIRRILTHGQQETLSGLCADLARITGGVVSATRPGNTEQHIAGSLIAELLDEGIETVALFVGADDRIDAHRHPLPTGLYVTDRVMVSCCGRRSGMVGAVTRMATFRALGPDAGKYDALLRVEQEFLDASTPGTAMGQVFTRGTQAYGSNGFDPLEWRRHHQGGLTGFSPRELIAKPDSAVVLAPGMALGWNPTGGGFKVEDTVLVTDAGPRILTTDLHWSTVVVGGRPRPAVMDLS